jgi:two-component system sensor histidine kinase CpxA
VKLSLRTKVLLLAVTNLVLVVAALVWFTQTQLTQDIGYLLLGESRARVTEVALQLGRELPTVAQKDQTALLERYSSRYGVQFYLFHNNGMQVAGPPVTLPAQIEERLAQVRSISPLAVLEGLSRRLDAPPPPRLNAEQMDGLLANIKEPPFLGRDERGRWVVFRMSLRSTDHPGFQPGILIMMTESFFSTPFLFDLKPWIMLGGILILIGLACWLPLVGSATHAIATLSAATANIARGKLGEKVRIKRGDELGQLGDSFNRMSNQLDGYVHGQKRFLRDAAHELRSPIARMQAALGNVLESNPGPDSEPFIDALREEIELMSSMTGELLTFAREENRQGKRSLTPVNLSEAVTRVLTTENPTGQADVRLDVAAELQVLADPESLFRGLSNIVRNAIRYASHAGPIVIAAKRDNQSVIITVSDQGPGIPEESLELIFTPFYRIEDSRNRNTGGNGLGMSIARTCIETCGGTIYCRNLNPGLQVTMTIAGIL